jgi:HEAT repeat protein
MDPITFLFQPLFIRYVLYAMIGTIVFVTLLLFVVLIIHKLRVESRDRQLAVLLEQYTIALSKKLLDPLLQVPRPAKAIEFEAMGNALIDMGISITGVLTVRLRDIARELGVDDYYRGLAGAKSWTKRYRAVEKLGFLKFPELESFFCAILDREKDLHVRAKTIWALSQVAGEDDLAKLNRFLGDPLFTSGKFKEYVYTNVIRAFRDRGEEDVFVTWLAALRSDDAVPVPLKKDIIEACGAERLTCAAPIILDFFRTYHEAGDMKIACIRALEAIGGDDIRAVIVDGLGDADWRVRAVAAKNADVCPEDIVAVLEHALHDKHYQVRINVAQALARFGERGLMVLRRNTLSDDRFVRDVTNYILGEKAHA